MAPRLLVQATKSNGSRAIRRPIARTSPLGPHTVRGPALARTGTHTDKTGDCDDDGSRGRRQWRKDTR
eukprot:15463092-Alexandrium_andersonii.AAC.1